MPHTFIYVLQQKTWHDARLYCESQFVGRLAFISSSTNFTALTNGLARFEIGSHTYVVCWLATKCFFGFFFDAVNVGLDITDRLSLVRGNGENLVDTLLRGTPIIPPSIRF